jgi:hypothetical protein
MLAVVLRTDIVSATEQAGQLDGRRWRELAVRLARGSLKSCGPEVAARTGQQHRRVPRR